MIAPSLSRLDSRRARFARAVNRYYIADTVPLPHVLTLLALMALLATLTRHYNSTFTTHPLLTMMATNTLLNATADTVAQTVTSIRERSLRRPSAVSPTTNTLSIQLHNLDTKSSSALPRYGDELIPQSYALPPPFDFARLARFAAWGCIVAPFQFKWFQFLSRTFPLGGGGAAKTLMAAKRVLADQTVFAPTGLAAFFTYMTLAEGGGRKEVKRKLERAYVPALKSNYILWPAVQMLNFRVIPLQFQLPFASTWGIAWGTYLSLTNSASEAVDE